MNYWKECISSAFDEAGIVATSGQIETVVESVRLAHELYGEAHGHYEIPNPIELEVKRLKKELEEEKDKIICNECKGKGSITESFFNRSCTSPCWKCNGEGRHSRKKL